MHINATPKILLLINAIFTTEIIKTSALKGENIMHKNVRYFKNEDCNSLSPLI
ncbi:hypothetical protein VCR4J2_60003 [Vibrio coralliirubri]|nr:hypothetical protein VCR4J2_60003 [Vibrio coralliirubri]